MRYFHRLASGVNVAPLMHAVARQPELWNTHRARTQFTGTPHNEVDDIWLHFNDDSKAERVDDLMRETRLAWYPAAIALPQVRPIVQDLMQGVGAYALDRLLITRLRPGGRIARHADDDGDYVSDHTRSRYHVVLQGLPGSLYHCGDETVQMLTGEVYWFDAHAEHAVENNSADDRVHLLVDLRTWP